MLGALGLSLSPLASAVRLANSLRTELRHFMGFSGVQYGELQSLPITENADFEIEISFLGLSEGSNGNPSILLSILESGSSGKNIHIGRRGGNTFTFAFYGSDLNVDLTGLIDWSEINTIICKYTHADARKTIFLNGVEVASAIQSPLAIDWSNNPLTLLGRRSLDTAVASFQIDRIRVWWGGDRNTGTPVPGLGDIRIDDPTSIYQQDYSADQSGGFVGIELKNSVIPGDFEQYERRAGWGYWLGEDLSTLKNAISTGSEGTFTPLQTNDPAKPTVDGSTYLISADVENLTAGQIGWAVGANSQNYSESGRYSQEITAGNGTSVARTGGTQPNAGSKISIDIQKKLTYADGSDS